LSKRESFFECVFVSDKNEYRFHFRAWTPEDAAKHFRDALRSNGVTSTGALLIRGPEGELLRRVPYDPAVGDATV